MKLRPSVLLFVLVSALGVQAQSLDAVRANFLSFYAPPSADLSNDRVSYSMTLLEESVRTYTQPGYLRSDGSWTDINYAEVPSGVWSPWDHFRRLTAMAKAYRTPGQGYYRDPQLRAQIQSAIAYVQTFYGPNALTNGNWWFWVIGGGLDLGPTLVLMGDDIDPAVKSAAIATLEARIGPTPYDNSLKKEMTGQNLVWSCFTHLCLALLKGDAALMAQVRDAMATVTIPVKYQEGLQPDSSFQQHGAQLYTGGYGGSYANDVSRYVLLTTGTAFQLPAASFGAFAGYVYDGIAWGLYNNHFDVSIVGREVAKPSTTGYNGLAALLQMSVAASPRRADIRSAAARMLQTWSWALPTELASIAGSVESQAAVARWPSGYRHYYLSDYSAWRQENWFASVKMLSWRTKSGESTNGENLLGARQSDGRFYLVLRGDEYFSGDVWPALDWSRLPGTTVEQKTDTAGTGYFYGVRSFVGGTGDLHGGVSAMDFLSPYSLLTAKKSWFFVGDAVVFLDSGITCPSSNRVETIVEQWPLSSISTPLTVNGIRMPATDGWSDSLRDVRWAVSDGVGYYFPAATVVKAKRETRSGSWSLLATSGSQTVVSHPVLTLWLDHGTAPVNADAAYAIVPNVDKAGMRAWATSNPISIRANSSRAAAVRDNRTGSTGLVFWTSGAVDGIEASRPSIVWLRDDGKRVELSVADPTQASSTLDLTLPYSLSLTSAGAPVQVTTGTRSTRIRFSLVDGATVHASLIHVRLKPRAVRRP